MPVTTPLALHNPALLPPEVLLEEFTARRPMLKTLMNLIRGNAPAHPQQHVLLVGSRGMGKTSTLWAIAHSVNRDPDLSRDWQPVVFDEESRRVGDLADFWLEAIRQWEHAAKDHATLADRLLDETETQIESRAQSAFLDLVDKSGKRALLLIDNLNEVLASIHDPNQLHRLRALLMRDGRVMVIGGATRYFEAVTSIDQPFYDFFRIFELRPLSLEEMRECLLSLARTRGNETIQHTLEFREGTIQALHLLTGGNPRLVKTFYRLLAEGLRGDIRVDLEQLLDEFTPYFKAILDALPMQQQRILDAVALAWDPVEVASLARSTRLPSNQVSAQLRSLVKNGLISEAVGNPKRKSYLLTDRFSNIHYLMRHGRAARNRFDWFVALVRLVFPDSIEILAHTAHHAAQCGSEGQQDARDLIESALRRAESSASRRELLHATLGEAWDNEALTSLDAWFDMERAKQDLPEVDVLAFFKQMPVQLRKTLEYKPNEAYWWFRLTDFLLEKQAWSLAEAAYLKSIELGPTWAIPWAHLGYLLERNIGPLDEAEKAYRKAIELDPKYVFAWTFLGSLLKNHLGRPDEAESAYRMANQLDPTDDYSWVLLADLLGQKGGAEPEARACVVKALTLKPDSGYTHVVFLHLCGTEADDWRAVLPTLADWCASHPQENTVFNFTVEGFLCLARLQNPAEALALLGALQDSMPFETLRDAFRAHDDRGYLHRLAPERRALAIELLNQIAPPPPTKRARKAPTKR